MHEMVQAVRSTSSRIRSAVLNTIVRMASRMVGRTTYIMDESLGHSVKVWFFRGRTYWTGGADD